MQKVKATHTPPPCSSREERQASQSDRDPGLSGQDKQEHRGGTVIRTGCGEERQHEVLSRWERFLRAVGLPVFTPLHRSLLKKSGQSRAGQAVLPQNSLAIRAGRGSFHRLWKLGTEK